VFATALLALILFTVVVILLSSYCLHHCSTISPFTCCSAVKKLLTHCCKALGYFFPFFLITPLAVLQSVMGQQVDVVMVIFLHYFNVKLDHNAFGFPALPGPGKGL